MRLWYTDLEAHKGKPGHGPVLEPALAVDCLGGRAHFALCRRGVLWGIVVGGRESRPQGEAPHGSTQPSKATCAGHCRVGLPRANLTEENSNRALLRVTVKARARVSTTEEPDAGKLHVRVCAGGAG